MLWDSENLCLATRLVRRVMNLRYKSRCDKHGQQHVASPYDNMTRFALGHLLNFLDFIAIWLQRAAGVVPRGDTRA